MNKICFLLTTLILTTMTAEAFADTGLLAIFRQARQGGQYAAPSPQELAKAENVFVALFRGESPVKIAEQLAALHLVLYRFEEEGADLLCVAEQNGHKKGRGFYLFRSAKAGRPVLEAPHGLSDLHTDEIGFRMFTEGMLHAAAFNTLPRNYVADGASVDADMAHLPDSYFNAFTRAFVRTAPDGVLIQLHGFEKSKRKSGKGAKSDLIVSSGSRRAFEPARLFANCLKQKFPFTTSLYPDDISELGGTTNSQAAIMLEKRRHGFVHIEISRKLRMQLKDDAQVRRKFLDCLIGKRR